VYFNEILRVSKNAIIFGGNFFADLLPLGKHWIVWDKKGDVKFKNPYSDCELLWTNFKKNTVKKYVFKQQGFITDSKDKRVHPTQKPSELIELLLKDYGGDTILDPFMGSGTVGVACKRLKRNFLGIELDPKYFELAKAWIENEVERDLTLAKEKI
jgi:DNA modification methylase